MNTVKKRLSQSRATVVLLFCLTFLTAGVRHADAQTTETIPGTKVTYTFPSRWKYLKTTDIDDSTRLYLFCYKGKTVYADGDTALPFLRIYVRKNYNQPVSDLVFERYTLLPYQAVSDYVTGLGLPAKGGMGFVGVYTHPKNKKEYQFHMVYFKEGNTAVEFRLETTLATYPQMEEEFDKILKSLTF